ncbi:MAG: hypothetical protein HRT86_10300 [Ilumatobacteraceae bacterium]|nr:hypothetical protein [Ilumatobacteraceae bacterium]
MELLDFKSGVVGLLAVVGVALTTVMFNSYQDDSKLIQTILLGQQSADIKLTALIDDMTERKADVDNLKNKQQATDLALLALTLQIEGLLEAERNKRI